MTKSLHDAGLTERREYLAFRSWLREGSSRVEKDDEKLKFFDMNFDEFWLGKCVDLELITVKHELNTDVYELTPTELAIELVGLKVAEA